MQYYKKDAEILKKSGFIGSNLNTCFYVKKSEKCVLYIALYVDDNLMIRDVEAINAVIASQ